jgi:Protein of unknown function (DUF998)
MHGIKASWFGMLGVLFFTASTILAGLQLPDYSHVSQLISESYAIGTPYGLPLRFAGFLPAGLFLAAFAFYAVRAFPASGIASAGFTLLGIFYGLGTVVVSLFPCDEGCNKAMADPSISQIIHNLTGMLTYLLVPACILMLGIAALKWPKGKYVAFSGIAFGLTAILFAGLLSVDRNSTIAGFYQRVVEGSILLWILVCSIYLRSLEKVR